MFDFKKWNRLGALVSFLVALVTYSLTVEPTASYWDCAEYISTASKLEIGHPPGAPFFQMMGAFFAMFATNNDNVALMVNYMSVLSSAFTILFLYLTISFLARQLLKKSKENISFNDGVVCIGSAIVGAMAFTFSDSFWFNAVEAEVYAMAMLMMSALFWFGLKWVDQIHEPRGNKWLLLICFIIGLTFGVHFMALLAIPTIGMLYYFKTTEKITPKSFIVANAVSVFILLFIFKLLLPSVLAFFGYLEVFFVNSFGLPFNSGTIIAGLLVIGFFYYTLRYTRKKGYAQLNTLVLGVLFILIGFSTWLMIPIRANANTIINENDPSDARLLLAYYNLEQYPETHLFYGPMYSDMFAEQDSDNPYQDDKPKYERDYKIGKYIVVNNWKNANIASNNNHVGILPRMWSSENAENYMKLTGLLNFSLKKEYAQNKEIREMVNKIKTKMYSVDVDHKEYIQFLKQFQDYIDIKKPSFWQNMQYFMSYQFSYMYSRYFMWNFVGRQDDIQGELDNHGNWLSGINFIDELRLGSQDNLPSDMKNNKARNTYYFFPFILGLIGLYFQWKKNKCQFWGILMLFLLTGIALKIYLNERPFEPRERDYALVGSFYIYAIWIGMGVLGLYQKLKDKTTFKLLPILLPAVCLFAVPTVMAYQNWDDHDRSSRYTAQSIAKSYLESVDENVGAMLYTIGDNDTFALWYAQEVEQYRTDVRTINTSLLARGWYIDQMKRKAYESEPIPSQLTHNLYTYGNRDVIYYKKLTDNRWDIKDFMAWVASDDKKTKIEFANGQKVLFYPTNKIRVQVNKKNVLKSGLVKPKDSMLIADYIDIDLPKSVLTKNRIMMLDILANNDWKRPIYFTGGSFDKAEYIWLKDYLQLEGLVYKLVPIKTPIDKENPYQMGRIDTDKMYQVVTGWEWGNSNSPDIYHDPETRKNSISYRGNIARLSGKLIKENKKDSAKVVLDIAMNNMPIKYFGFYSLLEDFVKNYYLIGEIETARKIFSEISVKYRDNLYYYSTLKLEDVNPVEVFTNMERYRSLLDIVAKNDTDETYQQKQIDLFNEQIDMMDYYYDENEKYGFKDALEKDSLGLIEK